MQYIYIYIYIIRFFMQFHLLFGVLRGIMEADFFGGFDMKLKHEFVLREVAGETLLVPVGAATLSLNGMLVLNGSGRFLWEQLPAAETEEVLVKALLEEYEVDEATARTDVSEFLEEIRKLGIL